MDEKRYIEVEQADVRLVKRGKWKSLSGRCNRHIVKCPFCGNCLDMRGVNAGRGDANYCPNCGAVLERTDNG